MSFNRHLDSCVKSMPGLLLNGALASFGIAGAGLKFSRRLHS